MSADMPRTQLEAQGHARAAAGGSALLPSTADAPGLEGAAADPGTSMAELLASQQLLQQQEEEALHQDALLRQQLQSMWLQARNPFQQAGPPSSASAPPLQQHGSGQMVLQQEGLTTNLSDPGAQRRQQSEHSGR
jgi:hypothetical protein